MNNSEIPGDILLVTLKPQDEMIKELGTLNIVTWNAKNPTP